MINSTDKSSYSKEQIAFKLVTQLGEVESLIFSTERKISRFPFFAAIFQLVGAVAIVCVSFYFAFIRLKSPYTVVSSVIFMVFLVLTYYSYINMKNSYFRLKRMSNQLLELKAIHNKITQLQKNIPYNNKRF